MISLYTDIFYIFAKVKKRNYMKNKQKNQILLMIIMLVAAAAFLRQFIGIPNVTPIAAIALFGATYIKRKEFAILLPLLILLISDIFIGFYSPVLMAGVYGSFILIAMIGFALRRKVTPLTIAGSSIASSIVFFIITNFVVWAQGLWYPLSAEGLISCYAMGLPFFRYEVLGTLAFTMFFFGSYELVTRKFFSIQQA